MIGSQSLVSYLLQRSCMPTEPQLPWPSFFTLKAPSLCPPLGPSVAILSAQNIFALCLYRSTFCHSGLSSDITCSLSCPIPSPPAPFYFLHSTYVFGSSKHDSYLSTSCPPSLLASKFCESADCMFVIQSPSTVSRGCSINE